MGMEFCSYLVINQGIEQIEWTNRQIYRAMLVKKILTKMKEKLCTYKV